MLMLSWYRNALLEHFLPGRYTEAVLRAFHQEYITVASPVPPPDWKVQL